MPSPAGFMSRIATLTFNAAIRGFYWSNVMKVSYTLLRGTSHRDASDGRP